ncbi:MAG TPA: hypothetical protein VFQ53_33280 [Kofleriaceae bacterium]|nr:hypothetical protein [Kofleriaceae bacterium]
MRTPMLALAVVCTLAPAARGDEFELTAIDKEAHVAASYGITLTGAVIARRLELPRWQAAAVAAAATIVIATTKELIDDPYSWGDQLANGIGITAAVGFVFVVQL